MQVAIISPWEINDKVMITSFLKWKIFLVGNILIELFDVKYCAINVIYEIVVFLILLFASMTSSMKDDDGWGRCCQRQLMFLRSQGRWQLLYANYEWRQGRYGVSWILREMRRNCLQIENGWSMCTWEWVSLRFESWNKQFWSWNWRN